MDTKMQDQERAFPFAAEYGHPGACGGMYLRDWFAGQALAGEMASYAGSTADPGNYADDISVRCYKLADAMLRARTQGTDK